MEVAWQLGEFGHVANLWPLDDLAWFALQGDLFSRFLGLNFANEKPT